MDRPLTLGKFLLTLLLIGLLAFMGVGYVYTKSISQIEDLETKTRRVEQAVDNFEICQRANANASTNTERIEQAETRVDEMETILKACATKLERAESVPGSKLKADE